MWIWYQKEGELWRNGRKIVGGYSGAPGHVNEPNDQHLKGLGPIPRGIWKIGPPENVAGGYALRLTGISRDEPHRDRFLIHGDATMETEDASKGCIIIPRIYRWLIWESDDHHLAVKSSHDT